MDKTQVFSFKENDHLTKRMIHVLYVSKIARTIGRTLGLNEDLIEAISLSHDLGHVPFGHTGEKITAREATAEKERKRYERKQTCWIAADSGGVLPAVRPRAGAVPQAEGGFVREKGAVPCRDGGAARAAVSGTHARYGRHLQRVYLFSILREVQSHA